MKKIVGYLKDHLKNDFHLGIYSLTAIFLIVSIYFNYKYDFEDSIIDAYIGQEIRILWYFLLYGVAYYFTCFVYFIFKNDWSIVRQPAFWMYSLVGLLSLSLNSGFPYNQLIITHLFPVELHYFTFKLLNNLRSVFLIFLPLFIFYKLTKDNEFYGINSKNVDMKPYALMLLIMVPLITWASFQEDFLNSYPTYKPNGAAAYLNVSEWLPAICYELAYGWSFVSIELLFRGFFVLGLTRILGPSAILPMVTMYAFLHFGKPLGETIGSIFGGYVLGVIALYSRNIWGGIAIHLGVAWLMELGAFIGKELI